MNKFCGICGSPLNENGICVKCSNSESNLSNNSLNLEKNNKVKKKLDKKILFIGLGILFFLLLVILCLVFIKKNPDRLDSKRVNELSSIDKNKSIKFVLNEKEYFLGEKTSTFFDDGYYIDNNGLNNDYIIADSFIAKTFYYEGLPMFFAAMYCPLKNNCTYNDLILIKIIFYDTSNVVVDDDIKYGMTYAEIKDKLGKEDGKYYQDSELRVWNLKGKKVGDAYYILRFGTGKEMSSNKVKDLRIGIWWYDGEADHTIK